MKAHEILSKSKGLIDRANSLAEQAKAHWNNNFEVFIFDDGSVLNLSDNMKAYPNIDSVYTLQESVCL